MKALTNKETRTIFFKHFFKTSNLYTTFLFFLKTKQNSIISWKTLSQSNTNTHSIFLIFWIILKYILIPVELIHVRKEIFKMVFNEHSPKFTETELIRLTTETTNIWLNNNFDKVYLLEIFCDKLLSDEYICEKICFKANIKPEDYQVLRLDILQIFQRYECTLLNRLQSKEKNELWERFNKINPVLVKSQKKQANSYKEEFEKTFTLTEGDE